jgi:hypothetical protein
MHGQFFFVFLFYLKKHLAAQSQKDEWSFDEKLMKFKLEPKFVLIS